MSTYPSAAPAAPAAPATPAAPARHGPRGPGRRVGVLLACAAATAVTAAGVTAQARADVAPHLHLLAVASVPLDVYSARVVYYPTNNQFARDAVVSGCFKGLQPGSQYRFPDTLVVADDNNNARQHSLYHNVTIQGFADPDCEDKSAYAEILVRHNEYKYWWVDENTPWWPNR